MALEHALLVALSERPASGLELTHRLRTEVSESGTLSWRDER